MPLSHTLLWLAAAVAAAAVTLPTSHAFPFSSSSSSSPPFSSSQSPLHGKRDPALTYATLRSPPISLRSGQIANTISSWGPLPWVPGPLAIRHFDGKIVDDTGRLVPLTEVYVHHWVIYQMDPTRTVFYPNGGLCSNLPNIFGIGAELYHTEYNYPAPYAVVTTGEEVWTANMHLIRTTNVPDVQSCIECHCAYSDPPNNPVGGIACCPDKAMCWGMENSTLDDARNYYLQYTIGYVSVTPDVVPLTVFSMDVTAKHNIDCQTEFQVPALPPGQQQVTQTTVEVPGNWSVVFVEGHIHIGGASFSVEHIRGGRSQGMLCSVEPLYGSGGDVPGNETGYLVGLPPCIFPTPRELWAGDQLRLTAVYDARTLPGGHAWHEGVMGLAFIAAHTPPQPPLDRCLELLHVLCGIPPYPQAAFCLACANFSAAALQRAGCTLDMVEHECNKTAGSGVLPVPPAVQDVYVQTITLSPTQSLINMTGPSDSWFAFGITFNTSIMDGATAFVYTLDEQGVPALEVRLLGNHAPGTVIVPRWPANITHFGDGLVQIIFDPQAPPTTALSHALLHAAPHARRPFGPASVGMYAPASSPYNYVCYLFARGSGSLTLDYHGTARGTSCFIIPPPPPPPPPSPFA